MLEFNFNQSSAIRTAVLYNDPSKIGIKYRSSDRVYDYAVYGYDSAGVLTMLKQSDSAGSCLHKLVKAGALVTTPA